MTEVLVDGAERAGDEITEEQRRHMGGEAVMSAFEVPSASKIEATLGDGDAAETIVAYCLNGGEAQAYQKALALGKERKCTVIWGDVRETGSPLNGKKMAVIFARGALESDLPRIQAHAPASALLLHAGLQAVANQYGPDKTFFTHEFYHEESWPNVNL